MAPEPGSVMTIIVPADVQFFRPVRLAVGGLGTLVGFDIDAMEDIRMGVDELCGALFEAGDGSDIEVKVTVHVGDMIHVECSTPMGDGDVNDDRFVFSERILSVVVDAYGIEAVGGTLRCWLERSLADQQVDADAP